MKVSCFVYYRVSPDHVREASLAANNVVDRVRTLTGVSARLMTKVGEPLLWMEVYEDIGEQSVFLSAMHECVEEFDLERWIEGGGQRHTEVFQCA